ncbi:MAG: YfhO family protein [Clostridia bacterium]|nr:YfhO family protein [Clostridia bacterium]
MAMEMQEEMPPTSERDEDGLKTTKKTEGERKKKSIGKRLDAFLDKNFVVILTFFIVLFSYFFMSWVYDVYPFSKSFTAASYDFSAQICPFFEHVFDVLKGKSSLTYSYAIMGGADVMGMFLYTFVSPFSVLFLIFGEGNAVYAAAFVVGFKIATIGLAGAWFANKLFKNIPDYLCVIIGCVYAYCGYAFVASTFIAWLDLLIYLPFCVGAFRYFVRTDNFWPFAILSACCIYAHFSIASFGMFTVFPALIAYALFCVEKERRNKFIARLCLAFFLAVVMALPVLLPALSAYTRSSRVGGLFDNIWWGYDTETWEWTNKIPNSSQTYTERYEEYFYKKASYILADAAFVVLTVVWFFRTGLKNSMAKFMLTAGILTLLPVVVDESMLLLNMGSYLSYSLRFGFLNALYFLGGACLCLDGLCFKENCAYDGEPLYQEEKAGEESVALSIGEAEEEMPETEEEQALAVAKPAYKERKLMKKQTAALWGKIWIFVGGVASVLLATLCFFSWYVNCGSDGGNEFYNKYQHIDLIKNLRNVPGSYAHSLGGADLIAVLVGLVSVTMVIGITLVSYRRVSVKALSKVLTVVLAIQTVFYSGLMVEGNRSTQHKALEEYKEMSAVVNDLDDSYFRVKDYGRMYYNDNSAIRLENVWSNCVQLQGDTNSYSIFSSIIDADNYITRSLFAYQGGSAGYKTQHNYGYSYRSDYFADCFLGYKYVYVPNNTPDGKELIHTKKVFEKKYVKSTNKALTYDYMTKIMVEDAETKKDTHLHSSNFKFAYVNNGVFPLGYRVSGQPYKFVKENIDTNPYNRRDNLKALYEFLRGKPLIETGEQYSGEYIPLEVVWELSEYLHGKAADVQVEAGEITATVTAEAEDEYLFLNFVASKGYTVTVNGKKAELVDNDLKFLMVKLEQGENVVHFSYSSPYVKYAGVGTIAALVLVAGVFIIVKKTKLLDKCAPVVAWAGIGLGVALVAFFMVYPTGIFAAKLVEILRLKL